MYLKDIIEATFLERQNRFVGIGKVDNQLVKFHIGDTGALPNLLFTGNKILIQKLDGGNRKYNFRLIAAKGVKGDYILTNSLLHSALVREYLEKNNFYYKAEVEIGDSRIDFLLDDKTYVEVKGCTFFKKYNNDLIGLFPDAPTVRGQKHLKELIRLRKIGYDAQIWFLLSDKANKFLPNFELDEKFSKLFKEFILSGGKVRFLLIELFLIGGNVELKLKKLNNVEILDF